MLRIKDDDKRREWIRKTVNGNVSTRRLRVSLNADRLVPERELTKPKPKGKTTHLVWINRLIQWWAQASTSPEFEEMTKEEFETVLTDFAPVLGIVDELRRKAESAPQLNS